MHSKYSKLKTLWDPFAAEVKRLAMEADDYIDDCLADELVDDLEQRVKTIVSPCDAQFSIYDVIVKLAIEGITFQTEHDGDYIVRIPQKQLVIIHHNDHGYAIFTQDNWDDQVDESLINVTHPQEVIHYILKEEE